MAKAIPNPGLAQASSNGKHPTATLDHAAGTTNADNGTANPKILDLRNGIQSYANGEAIENPLLGALVADERGGASEDVSVHHNRLGNTNADFPTTFEQTCANGNNWVDRVKEYESLLEEKSDLIRTLHLKIQELESAKPAPATPKEEELLSFSEELERERCRLQQDKKELEELRQRLTDDEKEMLRQMRDMEVQMARERADFARQRTDLQRILEEIRRELDNVERNGHLNQRLGHLRQRFHDMAISRGAVDTAPAPHTNRTPPTPEQASAKKKERGASAKDPSVFRRFFSKK
jgi:chromosome segregation ATPase